MNWNSVFVNNKNMNENDLIELWESGLNKYQVAEIYRRCYNQRIKIIRRDIKHRHVKFLNNYEALKYIEKILLNYIKNS